MALTQFEFAHAAVLSLALMYAFCWMANRIIDALKRVPPQALTLALVAAVLMAAMVFIRPH